MLLRVLPFPGSLLTILEFRMPGNASRGRQAMRFTTSNPFAALDAVMEQQSDGSGSSGPASLSDGSMSQNSYPTAALAAPTRGPVYGGPPLGGQHLVSKRCFSVWSCAVY